MRLPTQSSLLLSIAIFFSLLFCLPELRAQFNWVQANTGIEGAYVYSIAFGADNRPIISTYHGLYKGWYDRETEEFYWRRFDTLIRYSELIRSPGGRLFCRTMFGIYTSTDDGLHWDTVVSGKFYYSWFVRGDSTVGWHDGTERTLWITHDLGKHVSAQINGPPIYTMQIGSTGELYGGPYGSSLYVSFDDGASWKVRDLKPSMVGSTIYTFKVVDSTLFAADEAGLLRSTDQGVNWQRIDTVHFYSIYKGEDGNLYGFGPPTLDKLMGDYRLYRSQDGGLTWQQTGTAASPTIFAVSSGGQCLTTQYSSMVTSNNYGATWTKQGTGLTNLAVDGIASDPANQRMYTTIRRQAVQLQGLPSSTVMLSLHTSTNNGKTWTPLSDTLNRLLGVDETGNVYAIVDSISIDSLATVPGYFYTYKTDKRVAYSHDFGKTWRKFPMTPIEKRFFNDAVIHSSASGVSVVDLLWYDTSKIPYSQAHTIFLSTNAGLDWKRMENPLPPPFYINAVHVLRNGELLVEGHHYDGVQQRFGLWRYEPTSGSVAQIDTIPTDQFVEGQDGLLYRFSRIYYGGYLYSSDDDGRTWRKHPVADSLATQLTNMKVGPDGTIFILMAKPGISIGTLYRSTDRGITWTDITVLPHADRGFDYRNQLPALILEDNRLLDTLHFDIDEHPFGSAESFYHYMGFGWSDDKGDSWNADTAALNWKNISAIALTPTGTPVVGTLSDGLFVDEPPASVRPELLAGRDERRLRVAPIPTTGNTTASFRLEKPGHVRLELFDLLGRPVALFADRLFEAGEHAILISLQNTVAGSYFLQLSTDQFTESTPVLVQ